MFFSTFRSNICTKPGGMWVSFPLVFACSGPLHHHRPASVSPRLIVDPLRESTLKALANLRPPSRMKSPTLSVVSKYFFVSCALNFYLFISVLALVCSASLSRSVYSIYSYYRFSPKQVKCHFIPGQDECRRCQTRGDECAIRARKRRKAAP